MPKRTRRALFTNPKRRRKTLRRGKGRARPINRLRLSYRGTPNQYRFVRETVPITIDVSNPGNGVSIIPSGSSEPNMSVLQFPNFQMQLLSGFMNDFNPLFANYKIDRIDTILIPQWQMMVANFEHHTTQNYNNSNLVVTRVSTKYLNNGFTTAADAVTQRMELAQLQMKTRSLYGSKKWLRIRTNKPGVQQLTYSGDPPVATGVEHVRAPWLSINNANDQEFLMNDVIFFDRLDGNNISATGAPVYQYRMYHRVYFRVSHVG